jgi:outer membrane protein assembly factor BamB
MPINCTLNQGYVLGCNTVGGVEKVWVGTWDADTTYAFDVDNVVTGITSASTVYLMEQDIEFAGLTQAGQFSRENGTVFYESNLSIKFTELDKDLRNLLVALGRAPLYAIIKSNSGQHFICGVETAGRATEGNADLGVALGDMNGATLTIQWKSRDGVYLINPSLIGTSITVG